MCIFQAQVSLDSHGIGLTDKDVDLCYYYIKVNLSNFNSVFDMI